MVDPQGFSSRDSSAEQERVNREILDRERRRRSRSSSRKSPSVTVRGGEVFIGGQGFSVSPSLQEQFIRERTGGISRSLKESIDRERARQEQLRQEKLRQERLKQEQSIRAEELLKARKKQETVLVKSFRESEAQKKRVREEENKLKKEIERLERQRREAIKQSISKSEFDKIVKEKLEKEKELNLVSSGIKSYNNKVDIEVRRAEKEFNKFVNDEFLRLQAQVDSGKMDPNSANIILKNKVAIKEKNINESLNNRISKIKVPEALKKSVGVVREVEQPKGFLDKAIKKLREANTEKKGKEEKLLDESIRGLKEIGIGLTLGGLSYAKGIIQLPKTITTFIKNPSLIKDIPKAVKIEFKLTGESLKISPTRTVAKIGTEIFLTAGTGKALKILRKVTNPTKISKYLKELAKSGDLSDFNIKFIGGAIPKIELTIKPITRKLKKIDTKGTVRSINKDVSKLIPKTIPKSKIGNLNKFTRPIIENFLKDKKVVAELLRKFPGKKKFGFNEFKKLKAYPKLKNKIKRSVFPKFKIKAIREVSKKAKVGKREIGGVKVRRKEFKSFQEASKEFEKIKRIGKLVNKIDVKGGVGKIESLPTRALTTKELDLFNLGKKIPKSLLKNVKSASVNTFVQKFTAEIPVIKRFGDLKKGFWRLVLEQKTFYQNSVSFSLFDKAGKPLGTITFNSLATKPITRFRSLSNALKWGTNKEIVLSKLAGRDFVRSFLIKSKGKKISKTEFLSKIRVTNKGRFQEILIATRKTPRLIKRKKIAKEFEKSIPVSKTKGIVEKVKQPLISRFNKKTKVLEIVQRGKTVQKIKTKGIVDPVIIDTSIIEGIIKEINKINKKGLTKATLKRLSKDQSVVKLIKKRRPMFKIGKKNKTIVSRQRLKQINKISTDLRTLKESLAGRTIPPKIRITRRVEGVKQLRKLKKIDEALKKLRRDLIKRKALDIAGKAAISQALILSNKLKSNLRSGTVTLTDNKTKQLQNTIQKSLQKSKNKSISKTLSKLQSIFPTLILVPGSLIISPRVPRTKKKRIIRKKDEKEEEKKFRNLSKPVKIFSVVVKKRNISRVIKDKLKNEDALNFMAYELDEQLLRSAVLKQTGVSKKIRILPKKYDKAFEKRKDKFRKFKIKGKKKIPIKGFIEKKKFAIDTAREKAQLKRVSRKKTARKKTVRKKTIKKTSTKKRTSKIRVKSRLGRKKK